MSLTQPDLRGLLTAAGLPALLWQLPDETYETASADWVLDNWRAWIEARPGELLAVRDLGGGKTDRVPKWIAEAGDCDNLALATMMWADTGNALAAVRRGQTRGGLAYGVLFFIAGPARAENFRVSGGHCINWFVTHEREVRFFEPGVGDYSNLNTTERSGAWFGLAA
ncbi:MAG: hypothetical protein HZA93_23665 [Verrucomicrobia bacterium]|nr:hypothetical protein [Verrucomicrobiota bacterium]